MGEFSMYVFDKMVKALHYDGKMVMFYHFKIPGSDLDRGILPLSSDEDVENLLRYVKNNKVIDVYIEQGKTTLDTNIVTPQKGRVEINKNNEVGQCSWVEKEDMELVTDHGGKTNLPIDHNFDPFDGINFDDIHSHELNNKEVDVNDNQKITDNEKINDNLVGNGDTDAFIVDEEHIIDEPEVDMTIFRLYASIEGGLGTQEIHVEPQVVINKEDLDVIDFDFFESEIDDDIASTRRKEIRKVRKQMKANASGSNTYNFYVGKQFTTREIVKDRIKKA
ncbi:hypothetical protein Tco_1377665 [Tanacetum coccineum]